MFLETKYRISPPGDCIDMFLKEAPTRETTVDPWQGKNFDEELSLFLTNISGWISSSWEVQKQYKMKVIRLHETPYSWASLVHTRYAYNCCTAKPNLFLLQVAFAGGSKTFLHTFFCATHCFDASSSILFSSNALNYSGGFTVSRLLINRFDSLFSQLPNSMLLFCSSHGSLDFVKMYM